MEFRAVKNYTKYLLTFYQVLGGQFDTLSTGWIFVKTCWEPQVFFVCISHIEAIIIFPILLSSAKKYLDLHNLNKLKHREHQKLKTLVQNFNRAQKLSREFKSKSKQYKWVLLSSHLPPFSSSFSKKNIKVRFLQCSQL